MQKVAIPIALISAVIGAAFLATSCTVNAPPDQVVGQSGQNILLAVYRTDPLDQEKYRHLMRVLREEDCARLGLGPVETCEAKVRAYIKALR